MCPCGDSLGDKLMKRILTTVLIAITLCTQVTPSLAETNAVDISIVDGRILVNQDEVAPMPCKDDICPSGELIRVRPTYSLELGNVSESSTQILININSPLAPRVYEFHVDKVAGIEPIHDGSLYRLFDSEGSTVSWLLEPWAYDASGKSIPTHFEFSGGKLYQFVDFHPEQNVFPIIADPYLWIDLISDVNIYNLPNSKKLKVAVTPWLGTLVACSVPLCIPYGPGVVIAQNFGWQEVLDKVQAKYGLNMKTYIQSRPTFKDQWDCHAAGAPLIYIGTELGVDKNPTWDLEGSRPANRDVVTWFNKKCNW